jgi:predicted dehydrogenase
MTPWILSFECQASALKLFAMNRRSFLQTGLAATAALATLRLEALNSPKPIRFGIIGTGSRGTGLLQILQLFPEVEIRAVCDLVRDRANNARELVRKKGGTAPEVYADTELAWHSLVQRDDLDAVLIATPWNWHARMAVAAMRAGKHPGVEVPAASTLNECWELVQTSERTGIPCMMLENVCYFRNVMAILRMTREKLFGDLLHAEAGYQHNCRSLMFTAEGQLTWRGRFSAERNGNHYPTHAVGPVAQWLDINRGDRFVSLSSVSTDSRALKQYAAKQFGPEHPLARRNYAQGDINTTLLRTAQGRTVTLYYNTVTHRPYDLILRLEGVNGICLGTNNSICLDTGEHAAEKWESFDPYQEKYEHPMWKAMAAEAGKSGGHGGAEYLMFHDFLRAVNTKTAAPQDVYDAATWSAIVPLSEASVAKGGKQVSFPDFTHGRWKTRPPLGIEEV